MKRKTEKAKAGKQNTRKPRMDAMDEVTAPRPSGNVFEIAGARTPWGDARTIQAQPGERPPCPNCGSHLSYMRTSDPTGDGRLLHRACKRCQCAYRVVEVALRPPPRLSDRRAG
jgi:hypothetical protein